MFPLIPAAAVNRGLLRVIVMVEMTDFRIVTAIYSCQEKSIHRMSWIAIVLFTTICACASPARRAQSLAAAGGMTPVVIQGSVFQHRSFARLDPDSHELLVVFVEGDGSPWVRGGRKIARDPTPHTPLALQLAAATPGSVLYVGRPCYFQPVVPTECSADLWTSKRYSTEVVRSMTAAVRAFAAKQHYSRLMLVGYSGGGTLVTLMAPDLPNLVGLVSVAGNLDPDSWAALHHYLPLEGLNPALRPALKPGLPQWYLVGERDANVPSGVTARYLRRISPDRIWSYSRFDHRCCWVEAWPGLYARLTAARTAGE